MKIAGRSRVPQRAPRALRGPDRPGHGTVWTATPGPVRPWGVTGTGGRDSSDARIAPGHLHRTVVVDAGGQARPLGEHGIRFGRVQVAAGGVAPQRPALPLVLLPGGQAEGELDQEGDAIEVERPRGDGAGPVEVVVRGGKAVGQEGQIHDRGAGIRPERVRLVGPVQAAGRSRVAAQGKQGTIGARYRPGRRSISSWMSGPRSSGPGSRGDGSASSAALRSWRLRRAAEALA